MATTVLLLALLALIFRPSLPHPQCLDFEPPFKESAVSYCSEYRDFGCCVAASDQAAQERVRRVLANASEPQHQLCAPYLKNISCVSCSPYVAHIYETEGGAEPRTFPELCGSYCREVYKSCRGPLLDMLGLKRLQQSPVSSGPESEEGLASEARAFCEHYIPADSPYCYPRVLDGPSLEGFSTEQVGKLGCICGQPVAGGLRNPLAAVPVGDGSGRLFIVEQIGVVRVLDRDNNNLTQPFLDITASVLTSSNKGDERGLLGLAFHPNHSTNGLFYVYYSTTSEGSHHSTVSEFRISSEDTNIADPTSERVVLSISQPFGNHNGGQLLFLDGYLLVFLGDGGAGGDPRGHGLNLNTLLGSALRIDVDRRDPGKQYAIPPDNPFVNVTGAMPEIYAYGLRNPWRCSIDRGDWETGEGAGRIFCGDVGQNRFEEVDIIEKGGNYGWKAFEGNNCYASSLCQSDSLSDAIPPIHTYPRSVGVSITGGFVYRGCVFPNLQGLYIFGDYGSGKVFALEEGLSGEWRSTELCMGDSSVCTGSLVGEGRLRHILSFGEDEEGELYILATSYASTTRAGGVVYRIVDPARQASPRECRSIETVPRSSTVVEPVLKSSGHPATTGSGGTQLHTHTQNRTPAFEGTTILTASGDTPAVKPTSSSTDSAVRFITSSQLGTELSTATNTLLITSIEKSIATPNLGTSRDTTAINPTTSAIFPTPTELSMTPTPDTTTDVNGSCTMTKSLSSTRSGSQAPILHPSVLVALLPIFLALIHL